jgi:hypothetical protein
MIAAASVMLLVSYVGFGIFLAMVLLGDRSYEVIVLRRSWVFLSSPVWTGVFWGLVVLAFLHAAANYLLSRDDRKHSSRGISQLQRWGLRIFSLFPILTLTAIYWVYWEHANMWWIYQSDGDDLVNGLVATIALCPPITFFRLRWLALRLSRPRLAEHVTIVAVGCAGSVLLTMAFVGVGWSNIRHGDMYFFFLVVVPCALVALFELWAMLLLFLVSERFLKSARESRARWREADASRVEC